MPMAVMTESREKTISSSAIWMMMAPNEAVPRVSPWCSSPSSFSWISKVALIRRKRPPARRMRSRPEMVCDSMAKRGVVSVINHERDISKSNRVIMATANPTVRALDCSSGGSFPAKMEMKMMLSIPRTISRAVSVSRAIQA